MPAGMENVCVTPDEAFTDYALIPRAIHLWESRGLLRSVGRWLPDTGAEQPLYMVEDLESLILTDPHTARLLD
ncbi:hypothetical protein MLGJGCBP_02194 [Rhodococcus sp. T7]|nr:hypothetical protein MLGJGCBP_02194 [Rhodococcus sp. T7]